MTCLICHRPVTGNKCALALPVVTSRRKSGNVLGFAFGSWDQDLAAKPGAVKFCGVRCAAAGLERLLQSGHLGMPNTQETV